MRIRLTDVGKYKINQLVSWRVLLIILLNVFVSLVGGVLGSFSSTAAKEGIANVFAESADQSKNGTVTIIQTFAEVESRSEYIDLFNQAFELAKSRLSPNAFFCYSGYVVGDNSFSEGYVYTAPNLFGDDGSVSLFPSPVNSLVSDAEGNSYHEIWNLQMMFSKSVNSPINSVAATNFCYLPIEVADSLLMEKGIDSPSESDYRSLLGSTININFEDKIQPENSKTLVWNIANIFIRNEQSDFFQSRFGHFLPCYLGLPSFAAPSIFVNFGHSQFFCNKYLNILCNEIGPMFGETDYSVLENGLSVNDDNVDIYFDRYLTEGMSNTSIIVLDIGLAIVLSVFSFLILRKLYLRKSNVFLLVFAIVLLDGVGIFLFPFVFGNFFSFSGGCTLFISLCSWLLSYSAIAFIRGNYPMKEGFGYDLVKI